jgi:hypothetical protein
MNRRLLARMLAAGYRNRDDARAFIEDALADAVARSGWLGAAKVARLCAADLIASRWRPHGLPITAAALTHGRTVSHRSRVMDHLFQDVRFGLRQLRRQPGFALIAILTMALGVGANTAIFNVAWQTLLKPLPYPKSEQLVEIWETYETDARTNFSMPPKFHDLRHQATSFQYVAAYSALRAPAG